MLKLYTFLLSVLATITLQAQNSPGGVGNATGSSGQPHMEMWYDAADLGLNNNDRVAFWADKSDNGRDLSQSGVNRPTYKNASAANYNFAAVRFDGNNDFLSIDGSVLVNTNYTVIVVGARRANGRQVILGGGTGATNQNLHPYFDTNTVNYHHWGNDLNGPYTGGDGSAVNATTPNFGVFSFRLNSDLGSAQRTIFQNGSQVSSSNNNGQLTSYSNAAIGRFEAVGEFSDLDLAELIVYSDALTDVQLAVVNNYLAAKYGVTMDNNEYYAGDTPVNGNYDFNVTGIGQLSGDQITVASSKGVIIESNSSLDSDGEFILFGDDNAANSVSTSNLGTGVESRWNKTWYIDKTTPGTLNATLSFDITDGIGGEYPSGDKDNYVLLRENGGNFEIVAIPSIDKTIIGSKIEFIVSDANLSDGVYTLGTTDATNSPVDGMPNQTWYSYKTGDWNDPLTWTTDGSGSLRVPVSGGIPDATDNVVILSGRTVTMDIPNVTVASLEVNHELDLGATSGHNFNTISGNGTIMLSGAGGIDNFPDGNVDDFSDSFIGGTVEYYGVGLTINQDREYNNLILDFINPSDELILLADLTLNGDLTLTNGTFKINDDASTAILNMEVQGDVLISSNASILVGQGNTIGSYSIPGTMPVAGDYHSIYHQVTLYGDLTNQGTIRLTNQSAPVYNQFTSTGAATLIFKGSSNNVASLFGITDIYNLIIDKGIDQTYQLEINSSSVNNFTLYGPNSVGRISNGGFTEANPEVRKSLWIYNGTLHLTGNLKISSLSEGSEVSGNGDYPIGSNGALWLDGPNVSVYTTADNAADAPTGATGINTGGSNQALSLYGRFRISNGFFGTRGSAGFIFWDASAGEVLVEGGTVNVSQFRAAGGGGTHSYTQTGGTVIVRAGEGQNGETSGGYALFSLHVSNANFNMSGGTLQVYGDTGNGSVFINSAPGKYSVTGGTVIVENRNGNMATIATTVPFWNLTLEKDQAGDADEIDLITETSGGETITDPTLKVLNDFTIGDDVVFDHNGNNVEVGSDFVVQPGAEYVFDEAKHNTLTLNGVDNSRIALFNKSGGGSAGEQQRFYNLIINKPHNKTVTLESNKTGGNLNSFQNNLFRVDGEAFKVLSGTLDQGKHSILANCDTLVNYDVLTVYNTALGVGGANDVDANANGNNDQLKLASNQGTPTDIVILTADTAVIGNFKFFMQNNVVTLNSDLTVEFLDYENGRLDLGNNNLKVYFFNEAPGQTFTAGPNVDHMIVTGGNASDGGLSLYIHSNKSYTFPFGLGLTGTEPSSKYTPATVTVSDFSDDGFITIRPVDNILGTTVPSGDILSYYWKVDYKGFGTLPTVQYQFKYYDNDLDGSGNEGNFVPGKVLTNTPFTRSYEDEPTSETINGGSNLITFNGPSDAGFTLEAASYTAGQTTRFVGSVEVFYTKRFATGASTDWTDVTVWTRATLDIDGNGTVDADEVHDSRQPNAGDYPKAGDIAVIGWVPWGDPAGNNGKPHGVAMNNTHNMAELRFTPMTDNLGNPTARVYAYNFQFRPTVVVNPGGAFTTAAETIISGEGLFWFRSVGGSQVDPDLSIVDIGDFVETDSSYFIYEATNNFTYDNIPPEVPNLLIAGDGWGAQNRDFGISTDVHVRQEFELLGDVNLILSSGGTGDITVDGNLKIFRNNVSGNDSGGFGEIAYPNDATRAIEVFGDLKVINQGAIIHVRSPNTTINEGLLTVHGNIVQNCADGGTDGLQLYSGVGLDYVQLVLKGGGNNSFTNFSGDAPSLYNLQMDKGSNQSSSFTFNNPFSLNGPTDQAVKAIELLNGTLILDDAGINIDLTTGGPDFEIPASSALHVSKGTVNVSGDDSGIFLDGSLIISGGTVDMDGPGNGNNYIEYSSSGSATIDISSGSLIVGSQIRTNTITTAGILNYTQTGGTVIVGENTAPLGMRGVFEILNTGSNFTYTGGSLTIVRQNTFAPGPGVAALRILPSTSYVTQTIYIGNGSTPAGQINFGIDANVPLAGLEISGVNSPRATIQVNPLELTGNLLINGGATLDANGKELILNSDFTNNGTFTPSGNLTSFVSSATQTLGGTSPCTFFKFTKTNTGLLELDQDITIQNLFTLGDGTINDNGNTIDLKNNAIIEGDHTSSGGNGLQFSGSSQQQLLRLTNGTSTLGVVTIINPTGVIIPESNGYNFTIIGDLKMNGGIFNIGSSAVIIGQNADITTSGTFSVNNMIKTNSSFTDNGLSKIFSSGYNQLFTFPIGEDQYTPVIIDFSIPGGTSGSTVGSILARPANEYHPTIADGNDILSSGDINNVLQYYWTLEANSISGFNADVKFKYDQSAVSIAEGGYSEANYIAARVLTFNDAINKFTTADVDETTNIITFNSAAIFNGVSGNSISGDYFAGLDPAIPNDVAVYTSTGPGGNVTDDLTYVETLPTDGIAPSGAILVVSTGTEVTFNVDNVRLYKTIIESGGILNVDNTDGHRLGIIDGTGTLKITSNTNNASLPAADYNDFLSCSGGGLEYAGTGSYNVLTGITSLRKLTFSGSGDRNFPNNNIEICEGMVVDGPTINVLGGRKVDIRGNAALLQGVINAPSGNLSRFNVFGDNFTITGGNYTGSGSGITNVLGNLILDGGSLNIGSSNYEFKIGGNFTFTGGTFSGGSNNATLEFTTFPGNGVKENSIITGDFTGSNAFRNIRIDKRNSGKTINLQSDIEVTNQLQLTDGKIISNNNNIILGTATTVSPSTGKSNSYVTGKIIKENISAGSNFIFPIGSPSNWRPASLNSVSTGGLDWEAQYFNNPPTNDSRVDNMTPTSSSIKTLSTSEYWIISDGNVGTSGVNANVGLSWGFDSDVSASSSEREELEVMVWNEGISSWDNYGGTNFSGGHTQSAGSFVSGTPVSFSEHVFTLGSGDEANPLPITLKEIWGKNVATSNYLYWTTSSEINNDYFELQRSADGENYAAIATIKGSGTSTSERNYQYVDDNPAPGKNYYRLKQVDFDGGFSISNKIVLLDVAYTKKRLGLTAFPNPTSENNINLRIKTEIDYPVVVKLLDIYGRVCFTREYQPSEMENDIKLNAGQNLQHGIYIITAEQGLIKINKKIILN